MSHWFRWQGNDLLIKVKLTPGSRRDEIVEIHDGALKIRIKAPPVDGKANKYLCGYLAKICEVKESQITIESGQTTRTKTLRIQLAEQKLPSFLTH